MTPEQIKARSQEKVAMIEKMCRELKISIFAKQKVGQDGIIENAVFYSDLEVYPPVETPTETPNV